MQRADAMVGRLLDVGEAGAVWLVPDNIIVPALEQWEGFVVEGATQSGKYVSFVCHATTKTSWQRLSAAFSFCSKLEARARSIRRRWR
jgi:hypothetical protein